MSLESHLVSTWGSSSASHMDWMWLAVAPDCGPNSPDTPVSRALHTETEAENESSLVCLVHKIWKLAQVGLCFQYTHYFY